MGKVLNGILFLIIVMMTSSCRFNPDPFDTVVYGDFIYSKYTKGFNGEEGDISIIGLSEEGKKKEVLVFPNYLDGHRVVAFGNRMALKYTDPIEITNAKKIYFCNLFMNTWDFCISTFKYDESKHYEIFIGGAGRNSKSTVHDLFDYNATNYIDISLVDSKLFTTASPRLTSIYDFRISTISYYVEEDLSYFVDYVVNDKVSVIPPDPYRKGYKFDGWYENLTYTKEWDFDTIINPIPIEKNLEEYEYSEYQEESEFDLEYEPVKVYAKWIKIEG